MILGEKINLNRMKTFGIFVIAALVLSGSIQFSAAQTGGFLDLQTNQEIFQPGQPIFVYGKTVPKDHLVVRLFAPDGTIAQFDQIIADADGSFNYIMMEWPKSSAVLPFGTYFLEAISSTQDGTSTKIEIKFLSTTDLIEVPLERHLHTQVFAPDDAAINRPIRVYVQTTSDGLLIGDNPNNLLGTSHVHYPNGQVQNFDNDLQTLHQGLYFVDFNPPMEGLFVFHFVAFDSGNISHGSAATVAQSTDIGTISEQILDLSDVLRDATTELKNVKSVASGFDSTLEKASGDIEKSVDSVSGSVKNIEEGSSQLNSLLFPIVASIAIILALQIVIIARRR